jgi:hypothetical protein
MECWNFTNEANYKSLADKMAAGPGWEIYR